MNGKSSGERSPRLSPAGIALAVALLVSGYSVWAEQAPFMEALPYLLLLACMGAHLFRQDGRAG